MAQVPDAVAADFVRRFSEFWSSPLPERLHMVLSPNVVLVSPMTQPTTTLEDAKTGWANLLARIPDLANEVHRWGASDDGVFIEFTLSGTVGDERVSWQVVDRFILGADGLATERVAYYDPTPVLAAFARAQK
ncbi:MAG: nuclear transport factor 2 family protein [Aeromicrobium sp.]